MHNEASKKVQQTFSKYPKRVYPKGQILIFANENPEHIFYLTKGKVRTYDVTYRGDEVIVNIFKPGAFFPMSWALNGSSNPYFYKTEEETEIHIVPAQFARDFLANNPDVTLDLLSRVYKGMDGLLGRMVNLMSGTALSRLIYELIIECRRFGVNSGDNEYVLNVSETDLAARSGLSRETVSREMRKLKDLSLIEIGSKQVRVLNLSALEKKFGPNV